MKISVEPCTGKNSQHQFLLVKSHVPWQGVETYRMLCAVCLKKLELPADSILDIKILRETKE